MIWPVKNRLHDDESGLLTLLMKMGVALVDEAQAAMSRVAQADGLKPCLKKTGYLSGETNTQARPLGRSPQGLRRR